MPYQHCPNCRLTVHLDGEIVRDGPCPRCGAALADKPRRLFASTAPREVSPEAVRTILSTRGGRLTRERPRSGGSRS